MKRLSLLTAAILLTTVMPLQAGWWIFGQGGEEVSNNYIYLNDISWDELAENNTLYSAYLPGGEIVIRGDGDAGANAVGAVRVSIDDQETWQDAKISDDGGFEFRFTPETDKDYALLVKVMDTTGRSNEFMETRRVVTVSTQNPMNGLLEVLQKMADSYMAEDGMGFMQHVDSNFDPDRAQLKKAVSQDFGLFDDISLNFTVAGLVPGKNNTVLLAVSYSRSLTSSHSLQVYRDAGSTQFVFVQQAGQWKLQSMKRPLMFGISDPDLTESGSDQPATGVGPEGEPALCPGGDCSENEACGDGIPEITLFVDHVPMAWHGVEFDLEHPYEQAIGWGDYLVVIEEAITPAGPWTEVLRKDDTYGLYVFTDTINNRLYPVLYYRGSVISADESRRSCSRVLAVEVGVSH